MRCPHAVRHVLPHAPADREASLQAPRRGEHWASAGCWGVATDAGDAGCCAGGSPGCWLAVVWLAEGTASEPG